jgi:hypothetical protein
MSLKDLKQQLGETLPTSDSLLKAIGLQHQRTVAEVSSAMLGVFGLGMLVGVGVALLFAPLAGRELRENLGQRIDDATTAAKKRFGRSSDYTSQAQSHE